MNFYTEIVLLIMFPLLFTLSFSAFGRPNKLKSRLNYIECFNFVKNVEDGITNNLQISELKKNSKEFCNHISNKAKQGFCTSLTTDDQFDKIYELLKNENLSPESVCNKMGYSRSFGGGRVITEEQCTHIIDLLKEDLAEKKSAEDNSDENERDDQKRNGKSRPNSRRMKNKLPLTAKKFTGNNVCKSFSDKDKMTCQVVARIAYRTAYEELTFNESSIRICQKLQDQRKIQLARDET